MTVDVLGLLAQADMMSGKFVIALVSAIITALVGGGLYKYREGAKNSMKIEKPVPTVPVAIRENFATKRELADVKSHVLRVEGSVAEVRREQSEQFKELLEAGEGRAERISDRMDSGLRAVHARLDRIYEKKSKG